MNPEREYGQSCVASRSLDARIAQPPLSAFVGRCAVVTGAGSGLGRGLSHALAAAGLKVAIVDVDLARASEVEGEVRALGADAQAMATDVSSLEAMQRLALDVQERFGPVALLCNNAGVNVRPFRAIWDNSYDDYQWVMGVNFWGVVHGVMAFLPGMREGSGRRHIVNTCSLAIFRELYGASAYITSKHAVFGFSECLARELEPEGIDVTVVYPGAVRSRIFDSERLRPEEQRSASREIAPVADPVFDEAKNPVAEPEAVAALICSAIESRQRNLLTHPAPEREMIDRLAGLIGKSVEAR